MIETSKEPSPERIYEALARILERKHGVKITYTLINKTERSTK